ncbi:unnamed protein product [Closterium sp. NIES-53]
MVAAEMAAAEMMAAGMVADEVVAADMVAAGMVAAEVVAADMVAAELVDAEMVAAEMVAAEMVSAGLPCDHSSFAAALPSLPFWLVLPHPSGSVTHPRPLAPLHAGRLPVCHRARWRSTPSRDRSSGPRTGKVGDASVFRVWGSRAFVRDLSADKLSPRAVPCVFLGFPPDTTGWQFYHPTSRRVLSSQGVTFDESVPYYRLFPYRTTSLPPPLLFLAPGPPPTRAHREDVEPEVHPLRSSQSTPFLVQQLHVLLHLAAFSPRPVYGLRQAPREWHDTLRTTLAALGFAPSIADPSLFLRTDTSFPPFYIFVYVDDLVFATADTAGLAHVKSELQKRHTCTDLGELRSYLGLQITRDRAQRTITLTQSHMVQQVLQRFEFTYSSPQATPLSTRHSLSALPSDESIEPSGPYPELVGYLMYLMTCTRPDLTYPLSILARYVAPGRHRPEHMAAAKRATQRSSQGYIFSLGSGSVSWRSTCSSSVLGSSCEAEIYAGAMAAQKLRWLTYLLTDLGEPPRSPPVLYVDNKAMLALCREHRLEHRTKHIALRYFLARELQQRGQLRLAYVASEANTADIFTKALLPGDHQRFCTMLACFPLLDWSCDLLFSPTLPMGVFLLVPKLIY